MLKNDNVNLRMQIYFKPEDEDLLAQFKEFAKLKFNGNQSKAYRYLLKVGLAANSAGFKLQEKQSFALNK